MKDKTLTVNLTKDQLQKIILVFTYYADLEYQEIKNIAQKVLKNVDEEFERPMGVKESEDI